MYVCVCVRPPLYIYIICIRHTTYVLCIVCSIIFGLYAWFGLCCTYAYRTLNVCLSIDYYYFEFVSTYVLSYILYDQYKNDENHK